MKISTKKYQQLRKNYALFLSMKDNGLFEWDEYKKISQLNEFSIDEEVTYEIKKLKFSGLFNGVEVSSTNLEKLMYATVVINRLNNINVQEEWQGYHRSQTTINNYYYDDDDWLFNMLATQMIVDDINDSLYFDNNDVQDQDMSQSDDELVGDSNDEQYVDGPDDEPVDDNMNLDTYNDDNSDDSNFGDSDDSSFNVSDDSGFGGSDDSDFGGSDDFGNSDSSDFGDSGSDW